MPPEQQAKCLRIAEIDGWIPHCFYDDGSSRLWINKSLSNEGIRATDDFDDYVRSYDAIIPVIQRLPSHKQLRVAQHFYKEIFESPIEDTVINYMRATPEQLCDAVIAAHEK